MSNQHNDDANASPTSHTSSAWTDDTAVETPKKELTLRSGLAVAGAAMAFFVSVGFMNAFGVFQDYYAQDALRNNTPFEISWLGSFATFAIFVFGLPAGALSDKIGPFIPLAFGSILVLVGIFMTSLCTQYYQFFLAQGLVLGLGMSFIVLPGSGTVSKYFNKNKGAATGVMVAGSSLGGILWPIILDELFHKANISFGWSMRISGFIMIPLLAFAVFAIRAPLKEEKKETHTEEQKQPANAVNEDGTKVKKPSGLAALRKPPFIFFCLGLFIAYLGFFGPVFYISVYAVHLGFSENFAFHLLSILNAASLVGRVLPGFLADRFGRFNLMALSSITAGVIGFCWSSATSMAGVGVFVAAFGFASGAILSLQFACVTTLADKDSAGAALGATMSSVSISTLISPPIAGLVLERGWTALGYYTGATLLGGGILLLLSRLALDRDIRKRI